MTLVDKKKLPDQNTQVQKSESSTTVSKDGNIFKEDKSSESQKPAKQKISNSFNVNNIQTYLFCENLFNV